MHFTFSSDKGGYLRKELDETSKIAEEYFGTANDPEQIKTSPSNRDWIYKNIQKYVNIIYSNKEIIGFVFLLPASKELMNQFINRDINEAQLFEKIKSLRLISHPETVYLCSAVIQKKFRKKELATNAMIKIIRLVMDVNNPPVLFCEIYSSAGEQLVTKVAKETNLELKFRKE